MCAKFNKLAYDNLDELIYGLAKHPVKCKNGMVIGGGDIYPELNFSLPPMTISKDTMPEVISQYRQIIEEAWYPQSQWSSSHTTAVL